jgi:hypothetical protein
MSQSDAEHSGILKASSPGAGEIEVGMDVIGVDGEPVGRVKEVRTADFLLGRPMAHGLFVPYQFVLSVPDRGDKPAKPKEVVLTVSAAHLDSQGWEHG